MRFHYHDVRDMPLAILLACDIRRVVQASLGVAWTAVVAAGLIALMSWRISGNAEFTREGTRLALAALTQPPTDWAIALLWLTAPLCWWLGYGYITAPNLRSAALEIARDERGKLPPEPYLYRMAAGAPPFAFLIPACFALVPLALSPLPHIDGVAGGIALVLTLPISLVFALLASAGLLLAAVATPMMPPTAVVEGRDYLEAVSRPAGFVLQKPFRYIGYMAAKLGVVVFAAVTGGAVFALAWAIVAGCATILGAGDVFAQAWKLAQGHVISDPEAQAGGLAIASVGWASVGVFAAWLCVVSQSADLITYLLMRHRIEGATFDQVFVAEDRLQMLPNANQTAEQAEEARKRYDAQQAAETAKP